MSGPINWFKNVVVSSTNNPWWGRMLPWDKEGDNLITYTTDTAIIKVARSNPTTQTWTEIASIPSPPDHIQEQSQMVQLQDGTILMAMRNRQKPDPNNPWFGLPIWKSTDGGHSWSYVSQLDTNPNGGYARGLWEPFLYVLPNGDVAGFYANEKHADDNPSYSQIISERISSDGEQTWGGTVLQDIILLYTITEERSFHCLNI